MVTNKPLTSDINIELAETGSIVFARNRILTDGFQVSENEDGFTLTDSKTSNIVGACYTSKGIVYISTEIDTYTYFVISLNNVTILRTRYIEWNSLLDTEILYKVNDNNELIIVFWNGVDTFSNRPRLINIDNLPFNVDGNKEILSETVNGNTVSEEVCAERTLLFPIFEQAVINAVFDNNQAGNITQGRYSFCIKYQLEGGLTQSTIPSLLIDVVETKNDDIQYHTYQSRNQSNVGGGGYAMEAFGKWKMPYNYNQPNDSISGSIILNISNLDIKYKLFNLYIIKVVDDVKITVDSIEDIAITDVNMIYNYNGNSTNTNVDTSGILSEFVSFDKIQAGTILRDSLYLYNTKKDNKLDYQKYANNIKVGWDFKRNSDGSLIKVTNDSVGEQTIMPNEVYGYNIHLVLNDGSISEAFHIPGRLPEDTENDNIENDASYIDVKGSATKYKKFQLNPFVTNCYNASLTELAHNPNKHACGKLAYWHNANEEYNFSDDINSQIWDVDNNGIGVYTGVKITDTITNVRHHRFPNIESIYKSIPYLIDTDTLDYSNLKIYPYVIEPVFSNIKMPKEILNNIKGYVISYIVKEYNDNVIAGVAPILRFYPVNNVSSLNQVEDRPDDKEKAILFDFTLQSKAPKINANLLRIEYQVTAGKDLGGYGYVGLYPSGHATNMPIPTDGVYTYPDIRLGNGNAETTDNLSFGLTFNEDTNSIIQTGFTNGQQRNVKFISIDDFEYLQENNIVQANQYRANSIKCNINKSCFLTPRMVFPNNIPSIADLSRIDRITMPQSNIYHNYGGFINHNNYSNILRSYPLQFVQTERRYFNGSAPNGFFETFSSTGYDYYAVWSGHQFTYNESVQYNDYTFCQRYWLVSILNDIVDVHLGYKNKDVSLCSNVRTVNTGTYEYSTYDVFDDYLITNNIKGDVYYNLYTMLFTDYNYDIQDSRNNGDHPICTFHNNYYIPLRIPSYSRMNPHFRNGEKGSKPDTWIGSPTKYNKDSYDLSFLKSNNFRVNNIYDDSIFKVTHYFNYIFKSNVFTGINNNNGWRNFSLVDNTSKPNFKIFPSEKGHGVALNSTDKILYVQAEHTLFVLQYKDKLTNEVVLSERDILEAPYDEFIAQCKTGKIGAAYRRCVKLTPFGYIVIDFYARIVHLVGEQYINCNIDLLYDKELSKRMNYMVDNNQLTIDAINAICTIGTDSKLDRIIFSFKYNEYVPKNTMEDITIIIDNAIGYDINTNKELINTSRNTVETSDATIDETISVDSIYRYVYNPLIPLLPIINTSNITLPIISNITNTSNNTTINKVSALPTYLYEVTETNVNIIETTNTTIVYESINRSITTTVTTVINNIIAQITAILPTNYGTLLQLMQYYTLNFNDNITLNTIGLDRIYIGAHQNVNDDINFLYYITPFYNIVATVETTLDNTYCFTDIVQFKKVVETINTVPLTGTNIELTPSTQLTTLLGSTPTHINSTLFQSLLNAAMYLSNFSILSRDELYDGTYSDDASAAIYLGTVTTSNDIIINPIDPNITTLNITVKYSLLTNIGGYYEDVYFDLYLEKDEGVILKVYITDIYTMRMKYADNHKLVNPDIEEYTIHSTNIVKHTTNSYSTTTNTNVYKYYITHIISNLSMNYSLTTRVRELLQSFNNNVNKLMNIWVGKVYSETSLTTDVLLVDGIYVQLTFIGVEDGFYNIFITGIGIDNTIAVQTYDTYSLIPAKGFISKHDYIGNIYLDTRYYFTIIDSVRTYTQNGNKLQHLPYHNAGTLLEPNWQFTYRPFYIDIVMNFNNNMITIDNVIWVAKLLTNNNLTQEFTKSITHICIYTDKQCTGLIPFNAVQTSWFDKNIPAYTNGEFRFNNFRDMIVTENAPILDDDGILYDSNHPSYIPDVTLLTIGSKNNKNWFDNSLLISKFAVIRMYLDSTHNSFKNKTLKLINVSISGKTNNR